MDLEQATTQANVVALHAIAERCKRDLFYLVKYILAQDPNLVTERTHRELADITKPLLPGFDPEKEHVTVNVMERKTSDGKIDSTLSDQYDIGKNKLLVMMPRGTFKSSIVTIGFTLQYILNDPNARVLIDSETYGKAKNFLAEIKGHLEDNPKFRQIFYAIYNKYPDDDKKNPSNRWTDAAVDLSCRSQKRKEPSISCSGIDRSINGMHYDLIIADDLHSEKNVTSKEQIEQVINHYKLAFSLLDPGMPMIIIGTRWDYQDLYQHILDNERYRYNIIVRKATEDDGTLLFPERLTPQFLEEQKKTQGSYIYSCQYQNSPVDDETATFKRSYFRYKDWELIKDKPINWFAAVDPSYEGQYSDYAAFVLAGMDYERNLYVRDIHRAKMNYMDIINLMFDWQIKYAPRRWALETIATQKNIQYMLNEEQARRGMWLPVEEIKTRQATKKERIESLAPFYEFGRLWHINECKQLDELEYELLHFPKGTHDDVMDALSTVLEIAQPPASHRVNRMDESKRKRIAVLDKPRSPITGY